MVERKEGEAGREGGEMGRVVSLDIGCVSHFWFVCSIWDVD